MLHKATTERLSAFSDGVFAVLITVLVLDLRPPVAPTFRAPPTLANMAQLCSKLSVYRHCVGQSSPPTALRNRSDTTPDVVQFRSPIFRIAVTARYRVDGRKRTGIAASRLLRGGLLVRELHLHPFDMGTDRGNFGQS